MDITVRKLTALLLLLLLGLLPVQGALASFLDFSVPDDVAVHSMDHEMADHKITAKMAMDDCPDCVSSSGCSDDYCSSDHACSGSSCASCSVAFYQTSAFSTTSLTNTVTSLSAEVISSTPSSSPFRPPII